MSRPLMAMLVQSPIDTSATTFVTPPALMWRSRTHGVLVPSADAPGEGGVDDLVAGVDERRRRREEPRSR